MDKKTIGNWIMYHEIQRLTREGLSFAAIGKVLVVDQRTVKRYSRMSEAEYASFLQSKEIRDKLLSPYESSAHPAVSAAQMHDWLKEYHPDFLSGLRIENFPLFIQDFRQVVFEQIVITKYL